MQPNIVNCPRCGKKVVWAVSNRFRPFCSDRCKTGDLADWALESYRVPVTIESEKET